MFDGKLYCCLGVLAAVMRFKDFEDYSYLTDRMLRKAELPVEECNPRVKYKNEKVGLGDLNDGSRNIPRHTFVEIADLIEKQL